MKRVLSIEAIGWSRHQLVMRFAFEELRFTTVYWYPDVDLRQLELRYGHALMERVFVHIALFEINKIASLRPEGLDLGPYAHHHTEALEALWREVFQRVWAQWRFENDLPHEEPPVWLGRPVGSGDHLVPCRRDREAQEMLLFCGGGKDSLVSMKLLERASIPFASFAYASSVYGPASRQFALIDRLRAHGAARAHHRQIVVDDFWDAPVLELYGNTLGVRTLTAAETPSSIFGVLPILMDRGYSHAVLGHEASANRGNLIWSKTGEDINHQWGKSLEAERLLDAYVRSRLLGDVGIFSLLMPLHDVLIFELLRNDEHLLATTHSCNIQKPWCKRCPKCAYVWLSCRAHLSTELVDSCFGEDLLEVPENHGFFHDMLGLGLHTPFECIGHVEESRLALFLCKARGLLGPLGMELANRLPPLDLEPLLERYARVHDKNARLPVSVAEALLPLMFGASRSARERISATLKPASTGKIQP